MSGKKEFGREASGIATRSELEARLKARPKPKLERHLTISGTEERIVHGQVNAANENRIRILRERFSVLKDKARGDQAQARLSGKARGISGVRTIDPKKLDTLKRRLRTKPATASPKQPLVQKNLSLPGRDAARLKALSQRDGLSQAGLLIAALDAYETLNGKL